MGMRSGEGAPSMLRLAAGVQAIEAAGLGVAGVLTAVDAAAGRSARASSGIALTLLAFIVAAGLAWIASGIARQRPWSRTPAVLTQVLTGVVAVYLLQAHRFDWGVPALLLAIAGLAGLLAPASFRALSRSASPGDDPRRPPDGGLPPPIPPGIPPAGLPRNPRKTRAPASEPPRVSRRS
jgi:hypothetical protein